MSINIIYNAINKFFDCVKDGNSIICPDANIVITVDMITEVIVVTVRDGNRATSEYIPIDSCINDVAVGIAITKALFEMGVEL